MKLAHTLNRTVIVSIPAFFGDDETRTCTLVDLEPTGVWLAFDDWDDWLGPDAGTPSGWTGSITGFFPFGQILFIVDPSQFAVLARTGLRPAAPRNTVAPRSADEKREDGRRDGRRKQKDGKSRR